MTLNLLTTLSSAKSWAGVTTSNDDALLSQLIGDASRFILSYLERPKLFQYIFSDVYDGADARRQMLWHWPVTSVALVMVDGLSIPAAGNAQASGYVLEPWDRLPPGRSQAVSLRGYAFNKGYSNVSITYTSGYVVQSEPQTVPSSGAQNITVNAPYGAWGADQGVSYGSGAPLASVAANPAIGQYTVSGGTYGFAAGDAGAAVLISYKLCAVRCGTCLHGTGGRALPLSQPYR